MTNRELEEAIEKCRKNDRSAQKAVYYHFYGLVLTIAKRYCGSNEEAKELVNDIFYKIFTKIDQYQSGTNFSAWVSTIAYRVAIDHYRSELNKIKFTSEEVTPEAFDRADLNIVDQLEVAEKIELMQKLSPAYRLVFNLYIVEQLTHEEIAKELGISVGTSKSNLAKARNQFKALLMKYHQIKDK